jgi:hypothetical protein
MVSLPDRRVCDEYTCNPQLALCLALAQSSAIEYERKRMMRLKLLVLLCVILSLPAAVMADRMPRAPFENPCLMAPMPRLHIGMTVIVSPSIGQLNLRSLPAVSTGIENTLYAGNRLLVLTEQSCNRHFHWFRVEQIATGIRGWVAEGTWETFYVIPESDGDRVLLPIEWSCPPWFARECVNPF